MPVEFSVAAFRFGHSMVRSTYNWNAVFDDGGGTLELLFDFSATSGTLGGSRRLLNIWVADWRRMYDFGEAGRDDLVVPEEKANTAMRIDTRLVNPLSLLPRGAFGGPPMDDDDPRRNLAFRNLTRAGMLRLATGQQMVELLATLGVPVTALSAEEIIEGRGGAALTELTSTEQENLAEHTPLWFYVLREAEFNRGQLTGVGVGWSPRRSTAPWRAAGSPSSGTLRSGRPWDLTTATFRMVDLLLFAFEGKKKLLNPND